MLKFPRWPEDHPEAKRLRKQAEIKRVSRGTDEIVYLSVVVAGLLLLLMVVCVLLAIIGHSVWVEIYVS